MKKAKVILSSIAVLAVVGAAVAFKAKADNYCLYTLDAVAGICPSIVDPISTTVAGNFTKSATTRAFINCPAQVPTADCKFTFNAVVD